MDSEKMLLDMYKKHQYESTQDKIQGLVMIMSAAGILIAAILTAILVTELMSLYLFISVLICIAAAFLLQQFKVISRNSASLVYFVYICFFFIPINWYITGGISESTPYIAVIVMLAVMMVFSGKTQKIVHMAYLAVIIALTVYSIVTAPVVSDVPIMIYKSVAFIVAIILIAYFMIFMLKKYNQMHDKFLRGSIKDDLTRVLSRGVLDMVINYAESLYHTKKIDYIMIMIDVDKFKKLNDEYGHIVGDIVLRNTAACIKENMREDDFVIRYGGDEFLVVLTGATIESARAILDRIEQTQKCKRLLDFHISVSRGYAKRSECESPKDLIALADKRMYEDKEADK
ncbi:MAG: GGDEF domain-containing protein [Eubacteriales bacterium]|nr:GGDEF domain-containing protein [Eubacteriales bacterium]